MRYVYRLFAAFVLCWTALLGASHGADATTIRILALGASNTNGVGVSTSEAWPAELENMLRKKGYDANVSVNAINGQTSAQILARANAIEPGTQVVIFDNGGDNDRKHGMSMAETNGNVAQIIATIRAHGAVPIRAPYTMIAGAMNSGRPGYQGDGHHLTSQSHARLAAALVPLVIAAVKRHK
jgi:acyl-CoA thioesterase I